ncbi:MAG: histidine phosphatase family protein [Proteobacteria bacterium]|nr:histidine phosphatase family protein [Pseudomonadota bacterium]
MILIRHGQSEFNVVFSATRRDPGIRDPRLTLEGRRQAKETAEALAGSGLGRLICSPYSRAIETAEIIADVLDLELAVDPLVGERAAFSCDVGSPPTELKRRWPALALEHLEEQWWPSLEESEAALFERCRRFHQSMVEDSLWDHTGVVTHWGFILGITGLKVPNGTAVKVRPDRAGEVVHPRDP